MNSRPRSRPARAAAILLCTMTPLAMLAGAGLAVPAAAVLGAHFYSGEAVREGVVLAHTLQVHEVPEPRSKVAFELHPGVKLRMLDRSGDFVRVRLPNGLEGWTDPAGVSPLR